MPTIRQVLAQKGSDVLSIAPDATVHEAIKRMADSNIGSLVVIHHGRLVGIFTERHYARNVFLKGRSSPQTRVGDVMEKRVVCIHPDQQVEEGMALMSDKRVRHLPVIDDGNLLGLVSIGDLVKSIISEREFVIEQLEHYIHG
jgi:CBS domain-containing protein